MAKDDKGGGSDKGKKAAIKGVQDMQTGIDSLRDLHEQLGKQLAAYDKNAAALLAAMQKDNEAEQKKRWDLQRDLQEKIFNIQQDVTKNKAATQGKTSKAIDEYIRG